MHHLDDRVSVGLGMMGPFVPGCRNCTAASHDRPCALAMARKLEAVTVVLQ
jgi:hypothetical protein